MSQELTKARRRIAKLVKPVVILLDGRVDLRFGNWIAAHLRRFEQPLAELHLNLVDVQLLFDERLLLAQRRGDVHDSRHLDQRQPFASRQAVGIDRRVRWRLGLFRCLRVGHGNLASTRANQKSNAAASRAVGTWDKCCRNDADRAKLAG